MTVAVHTHETADEGDTLAQGGMVTAVGSFSGTLSNGAQVGLLFASGYMFFPMFYGTDATMILSGHATDANDADSPRMRIYNDNSTSESYAVDYEYIEA
jgi:hypothetical protein